MRLKYQVSQVWLSALHISRAMFDLPLLLGLSDLSFCVSTKFFFCKDIPEDAHFLH